MNFQTLFNRSPDRTVNVGLIGVGEFGLSLAARARSIPRMNIVAFCDREPARVRAALAKLGIEPADAIISDDPDAVFDAGIDIVVEATGVPEAGARHAVRALEQSIDVVMVTKETDSVVGPRLADLARQAGCVYTPVEGDQPALLIGLVSWARVLGLEIVAAGKSSEYDFVFDPHAASLQWRTRRVAVPDFDWDMGNKDIADVLRRRSEAIRELPQRTVPDFCEMCIVANNTGLLPDSAEMHAPLARTIELPDILRPQEDGGILKQRGTIEVFNALRRPDEASFAGGVFVVVGNLDRATAQLLKGKGIPVDRDDRYALLYNPAHLLGVEAPMTILGAVLLRQSSGGGDPRPVCDVVARATRPLAAGTQLRLIERHTIAGLDPLLVPAAPASGANPIPFYLAAEGRLRRAVPAGAILTDDMLEIPNGTLRRLRSEQDAMFLSAV